jgi:hypothetical protein
MVIGNFYSLPFATIYGRKKAPSFLIASSFAAMDYLPNI